MKINERPDKIDNTLAKYVQNIKLVDKISKDLEFKIQEEKYMKILTD